MLLMDVCITRSPILKELARRLASKIFLKSPKEYFSNNLKTWALCKPKEIKPIVSFTILH